MYTENYIHRPPPQGFEPCKQKQIERKKERARTFRLNLYIFYMYFVYKFFMTSHGTHGENCVTVSRIEK